ncbi:BlaI family transcriptional regulator [Schaalia turicensis]|nr:BlaI family transcriptional regulator [Schaalia turicensis]
MNTLVTPVDQLAQPDVFARELAFITDAHTLSVLAGQGVLTPAEYQRAHRLLWEAWTPISQPSIVGETTG